MAGFKDSDLGRCYISPLEPLCRASMFGNDGKSLGFSLERTKTQQTCKSPANSRAAPARLEMRFNLVDDRSLAAAPKITGGSNKMTTREPCRHTDHKIRRNSKIITFPSGTLMWSSKKLTTPNTCVKSTFSKCKASRVGSHAAVISQRSAASIYLSKIA